MLESRPGVEAVCPEARLAGASCQPTSVEVWVKATSRNVRAAIGGVKAAALAEWHPQGLVASRSRVCSGTLTRSPDELRQRHGEDMSLRAVEPSYHEPSSAANRQGHSGQAYVTKNSTPCTFAPKLGAEVL